MGMGRAAEDTKDVGSAIMPRRFPPPWSVEEFSRLLRCPRPQRTVHRCGLRFVYLRRLFANIRRLAERCGLVSVLNSQTPRFSRRIFHRACACLISGKTRQLNQRIVSLLHCRSCWQRSDSKAVGTREPTALPLRLAHRTGCRADTEFAARRTGPRRNVAH
jgi:hypothetical protein